MRAIRPLTKEENEQWAGAVLTATLYIPAFRDAIALLRPFMDMTAQTAYTDKHSRVGLSPWFFTLTKYQRGAVVLHETMHVLNDSFGRGDSLGANPFESNISSDLEINTTLSLDKRIDLGVGIYPKHFGFPDYKTMEQYFHLLATDPEARKKLEEMRGEQDQQNKDRENCPVHGKDAHDNSGNDGDKKESEESEGQSDDKTDNGDSSQNSDSGAEENGNSDEDGEGEGAGQGSGQGNDSKECSCSAGNGGQGDGEGQGSGQSQDGQGCDVADVTREEAADEAGIERASFEEQSIAKENTRSRIEEHQREGSSGQGTGTMDQFYARILERLRPPKVNWRSELRRLKASISESISRGRSDYSYRRPSRRHSGSKYIFPGMMTYTPTVMMGIDKSGSMGINDTVSSLREAEGILKGASRRDGMRIFTVDTEVKNIQTVSTVAQLDMVGGGGTDMTVAWDYAMSLPRKQRPDLFVLATDGEFYWEPLIEKVANSRRFFPSIILVSRKHSFKQVPEELHRIAHVIDISEDD